VRGRGLQASMTRGALVAAALVLVPLLPLALLLGGPRGLLGAAAGVALVVAFAGSTLLLMHLVRRADPTLQMGVALTVYATKAGLLLVALPLAAAADGAVQRWGALGVAAAVLAWTSGLLVGTVRARQLVYDEPSGSPGGAEGLRGR